MNLGYDSGKVTYTLRGKYNESAEYVRLDVIFYENATYVALQDSTGISPDNGIYWRKLLESKDTHTGLNVPSEDGVHNMRLWDFTIVSDDGTRTHAYAIVQIKVPEDTTTEVSVGGDEYTFTLTEFDVYIQNPGTCEIDAYRFGKSVNHVVEITEPNIYEVTITEEDFGNDGEAKIRTQMLNFGGFIISKIKTIISTED